MTTGELLEFARKAVRLDVQSACREGLLTAQNFFPTAVPADVREVLDTPERQPGFERRLKDSNLGLLIDDWIHLPNNRARMGLIGELFFPPASALDRRYGESSGPGRLWRYSRHIVRGLVARLTLR
jgi:hypothetical protein